MPEILLKGCSPEPLAGYLKALGVLRLVAEQEDDQARGAWRAEGFSLVSRLDAGQLCEFFAERYEPTPIVAPWNGGSGFYPKDNVAGLVALRDSDAPRLQHYRATIDATRACLDGLGIVEKPDRDLKDRVLLPTLRAELPDAALAWIDAAVVLTEEGPAYPPLLGTGGNDGRLDFTNNQMQRLAELIETSGAPTPQSMAWLRSSLLGEPTPGLGSSAIGQFDPPASGGSNNGPAFEGKALVNPWNYVLMLEGALLFAAAATRKLSQADPGTLAYPFAVRPAGVGYGSASLEDERAGRCEMWLPLWSRPASLPELRSLFGEGRAKLGRRDAVDGVDFARAIAELGAARGVDAFARYGFHVRNGLSYFATPLGRFLVGECSTSELLSPLNGWLQRLRRGTADPNAPASLKRAERRLREAILDHVRGTSGSAGELLRTLGAVEKALDRSLRFSLEKYLPPVPVLRDDWIAEASDGSAEFALAAALAAAGVRERLVRVRLAHPGAWQQEDDRRTVWGECDLVRNLIAILRRAELDSGEEPALAEPLLPARLEDVARFVAGEVDEARLEDWLRGLALVRFAPGTRSSPRPQRDRLHPPAAFALLSLVHDRRPLTDAPLPRTPGLLARGAAGDAQGAVQLALRRLRGSGLVPRVRACYEPSWRMRRITAALAFPISSRDRERLAARVCVPAETKV